MPSFGAVRSFFASLSVCAALGLFTATPAAADDPYDAPTKPASVDVPSDAPKPVAKKRRGGINPCMTPDPGFSIYDGWNGSGLSMGQALMPHKGGLSKTGQFDLVIHFHGHEPVRKEFVKTAKGVFL